MRRFKSFLIISFLIISIQSNAKKSNSFETNNYVAALKKVTNIMVIDVASPVAASRYYAYLTLSANECLSVFNDKLNPTFSGYLNGYENIKIDPTIIQSSDAKLASILAIFKCGQKLLPSGYLLDKELISLHKKYVVDKKHEQAYKQTVILVDSIIANIFIYIKKDGFNKLNNLPRYIFKVGDGYWKQTPPTFMLPIEPHWNTIRPFLLETAQQFKPVAPTLYDSSKSSDFYKLTKEVYDISLHLNNDQKNIALFWDCNPFAVQRLGHLEYGIKKISPGGHWIGITGIACKKSNATLEKTALVHTLVSLSMADAFIACWDEKYRSNRVRPETVIQNLMDRSWKPLIQTPPFPEYVSGHSVVSNAAAMILTQIFGENYSYLDDTEVEFGLPKRQFSSFYDAASEASLSRLYGGIHFRDAIEQGTILGKRVSEQVLMKLKSFFLTEY